MVHCVITFIRPLETTYLLISQVHHFELVSVVRTYTMSRNVVNATRDLYVYFILLICIKLLLDLLLTSGDFDYRDLWIKDGNRLCF